MDTITGRLSTIMLVAAGAMEKMFGPKDRELTEEEATDAAFLASDGSPEAHKAAKLQAKPFEM